MASEGSNRPRRQRLFGQQPGHLELSRNKPRRLSRNRQKLGQVNKRLRLDGIKSAEGPVMAGIVEGASEAVKVWGPHAMTGVETPPDRPGLAVDQARERGRGRAR